MTSDDDVDPPMVPPSAERVWNRANVLACCTARASLELIPVDLAKARHARLLEWLTGTVIQSEFEPDEWDSLTTPIGEMPQQTQVGFSWRLEGAASLCWALGRLEIPRYDELIAAPPVWGSIELLRPDPDKASSGIGLRTPDELEWFADFQLMIHWRLREFSLSHRAINFVSLATNCKWTRMPIEDVEIIDNDLALRGQPVAEADEAVFQQCLSIAMERHQAANWLIGQQELYSEVSCDT